MKITDVQVIVTCTAGQTYTLVKMMTDEGMDGVGEDTKNGGELAGAALSEHTCRPRAASMNVYMGIRDWGRGTEDWEQAHS